MGEDVQERKAVGRLALDCDWPASRITRYTEEGVPEWADTACLDRITSHNELRFVGLSSTRAKFPMSHPLREVYT